MNPNPLDFKLHSALFFGRRLNQKKFTFTTIQTFHNIHNFNNNTTGIKCGCVYI